MQPDTIIPDLSNPQGWNRYSYVTNRPVNFNDPTGHVADSGDGGNYTWKDKIHDENLRIRQQRKYWQADSAWGLMAGALRQEPHMDIVGQGLEQIEQDPEVLDVQNALMVRIMKDPRYLEEDFTTESIGNPVQLGQNGVDASNGATWMQRNANLDATVKVSKNGVMEFSWQTRDTLDLNPDWGGPRKGLSGFFYNLVTTITGAVWHGAFGASNTMKTSASWQTTVNPYCGR